MQMSDGIAGPPSRPSNRSRAKAVARPLTLVWKSSLSIVMRRFAGRWSRIRPSTSMTTSWRAFGAVADPGTPASKRTERAFVAAAILATSRRENEGSRPLIASIAANFDWRLCAPLLVSRRPDGSKVIIDGQRRWTAAVRRGDLLQLPRCLFTYDSPEDETRMFIVANRARKPMNRLDDFHAAVAAADEDAVEIQRLVTEAGLRMARNTSSTAWKAGEVEFTSSIAAALRRHGPPIVSAALTSIAGLAGIGERGYCFENIEAHALAVRLQRTRVSRILANLACPGHWEGCIRQMTFSTLMQDQNSRRSR